SFQTAEEYAYRSLRGLILAGKLQGGERLNQDELAKRLNVSRTPIRQAVLRLENEGLVFGLAVPNVDAKGIAEMERRLDALERSHTNITRWVQLHDDFHGLLFQH